MESKLYTKFEKSLCYWTGTFVPCQSSSSFLINWWSCCIWASTYITNLHQNNLYHKSTSEYSKKTTLEYSKIFKLIMYFLCKYISHAHTHQTNTNHDCTLRCTCFKKYISCHISTSGHVYCINIMVVKSWVTYNTYSFSWCLK
jgi:hypothetical protein